MSKKPHLLPAWIPMTDPLDIARIGKTQEELSELLNILSRALIQGMEGRDPKTDLPNRLAIQNEIGDVVATTLLLVEHFGLDDLLISQRSQMKYKKLSTWNPNLNQGREQ